MDGSSSYERHSARRRTASRIGRDGEIERTREPAHRELEPEPDSDLEHERQRQQYSERDRDREREREFERRSAERYYREEPRRPITRVTRACNGCRRAKIRCIGADRPPCERCWANRAECIVEKPPRKEGSSSNGTGNGTGNCNDVNNNTSEDRLRSLEEQMGSMRQLLEQVVDGMQPDRDRETPHGSTPGDIGSNPWPARPRSSRFWYPPIQTETPTLADYPRDHRHRRRSSPSSPPPRAGSADPLALDEMVNPIGRFRAVTKRMEDEGHVAKRPRVLSPRRGSDTDDLITQGVVSEEEASSFVDIFYEGCSEYINVYDPTHDDFASLRRKSAFSLTAVMMVGARVKDGGGPPSPARTACVEATRRMAMHTLVYPGVGVDDVKALILLAGFSENGWLIAGHAVRIAIDLGFNRAFEQLVQGGMGAGKTAAELEKDRALVERARVWLAVYRMEHQMSYGMGRPAIVREDSTIHNCRLLLDHPLSLGSDTRLIYAVELIALRAPLHVELTATPDLPIDAATLTRLRWAHEQFDAWEKHWDDMLVEQYGTSGFVRESLAMQRQLAELFINSQLLRGVRTVADVKALSAEKRVLALRAMHNALKCGEIALSGKHYTRTFPYGTHYTHVCAAFAASFLIRITRLFPDELDPASVATDVEGIADMLANVPAGRYARSLRLILRRARREGILPEEQATRARPAPETATLAPTPATDWLAGMDFTPAAPIDFNQLGRLGLEMTDSGSLPLFLNGELGTSVRPSDAVNFVGLEDFFVPPELDTLLSGFDDGLRS